MQITRTKTENQTDHSNMTLCILFYCNRCSTLPPPQENSQVKCVTTLIPPESMSPSVAETNQSNVVFQFHQSGWGDTWDFKYLHNQNLLLSSLVILKEAESYNRDISLGIRWKIPTGMSWRYVHCGTGHHSAWRWEQLTHVHHAMQIQRGYANLSTVTVQVFLPDTEPGSSKRKGPK